MYRFNTLGAFLFQRKCDHYWPEDELQIYHGITVEILNTSDLPDFTTRTFKLTKVCFYSDLSANACKISCWTNLISQI